MIGWENWGYWCECSLAGTRKLQRDVERVARVDGGSNSRLRGVGHLSSDSRGGNFFFCRDLCDISWKQEKWDTCNGENITVASLVSTFWGYLVARFKGNLKIIIWKGY